MKRESYIRVSLLIAVAVLYTPAYTHPGHQMVMDMRIKIGEEEILYDIWFPIEILDDLVSIQGENGFVFSEEEKKKASSEVEKYFKEHNPVSVDGIKVKPVLKSMLLLYQPPTFIAHILLSYPTKTRPRQVSIVWDSYRVYNHLPVDGPQELSGVLLAEDEYRGIVFTKDEPEFIWHSLKGPRRGRVMEVFIAPPQENYALLIVSMGIIVLIPIVLLAFMFLKLRRSTCWAAATAGICIALGLYLLQVVVIPMQQPKVRMPKEAEAKEIFKSLHANIYRAFDYKTEDDIYDALTQSVGTGLLDEIYNEVYQSLILREEGGAVARIQSVRIMNSTIEGLEKSEDSDLPELQVRCRWRVHGAVSHWGHTHARTNEYQAIYKVALQGKAWKIVDAETLEQIRLTPEIEGLETGESST